MKTLRFHANSIPTCDAYYLHFGTSDYSPESYLIFRGMAPNFIISFKHPSIELTVTDIVRRVVLASNRLRLDLEGDAGPPELAGVSAIEAAFEVGGSEILEIKRQLHEILGVGHTSGSEITWNLGSAGRRDL